MSKTARSARGDIVDFDLLAIKQQLATTPVPVGVNQRRKFIDEKDGIKTKVNSITLPPLPSALSVAMESVVQSAVAGDATGEVETPIESINVDEPAAPVVAQPTTPIVSKSFKK
jgi:hypothetical protein